MELILSVASALGVNGIVLFFVKRYFKKKDEMDEKRREENREFMKKLDNGLETLRLLSYARMSEEIESLLEKGYASPADRHIFDELYRNYKAHGWNGDMEEGRKKVYALPFTIPGEQ